MTADNGNMPTGSTPRSSERRAWVWIMLMVNIVFVLLLMTLGIIALRVENYLPQGTDLIFIVGKSPSVEMTDREGQSWKTNQKIDIFRANYVNGEGVSTVVSQDGTSVIAPGTETTYSFSMYNNGNMAVVYETDIDFSLFIGGEGQSEYTFPLLARLYNARGEYLIGSETEWVNVADARLSQYVSVLGASSYETFTFELKWLFEGGNDELDTMYGDQSVEKGVSLRLGINTYAEQHIDPAAQGGTQINADEEGNVEYGGEVRWLWLILLFINAGILIFYVSWLLNKRLRQW